jgi:hypothetical protein
VGVSEGADVSSCGPETERRVIYGSLKGEIK